MIDSFHEIARLAGLVEDRTDDPVPVMIRVTVGVEAHTHEFIATAHEDQKFGFSLTGGDAAEAVRRVLALSGLRLIGLHSHIGSQIFDPSGFEVAAHRVVGLLRDDRAGASAGGADGHHPGPGRRAGHCLHRRRRPARPRCDGQVADRDRHPGMPDWPGWPCPP